MSQIPADIFDPASVRRSVNAVEGSRISRGLGLNGAMADEDRSLLRGAAVVAFANLFPEGGIEDRIRDGTSTRLEGPPQAITDSFAAWNALIDSLIDTPDELELDDFVFFSAVGFLSLRSSEVRAKLRRPDIRRFLDRASDSLAELPWLRRVRETTNLALLQIVRQATRTDLLRASQLLQELAKLQKETESVWLEKRAHARRDSATLLGFYHLAHAIIRTSEFVLKGSVSRDGGEVGDFAAELQRLIIKGEEYLTLAGDFEQVLWLQACATILLHLRSESIWVSARNISERIDQLLNELVSQGRDQPVFSLLPSQRDALRQALLDRSRIAVVLQMPTSSGKTLLAEFSIAQTFDAYRDAARCAYVVPTRALATQIRRTLAEDLGPLGITVSAAGGAFEEDPYELNLLMNHDGVVVATPEKLDLLLRAHPEWAKNLRLVVVDEAHLLGERKSDRGVRLELLLANIRREYPQARLLLLTPFMKNAQTIAEWLGQDKGQPIEVHWRPSRLLLGLANFEGRRPNRALSIAWADPYAPDNAPPVLAGLSPTIQEDIGTKAKRVLVLAKVFEPIGTVLALFSASPEQAEEAAIEIARQREPAGSEDTSPSLRLAIALARNEYGEDSDLAFCLERGTAFHHSSLSSTLRYLVEDQVRAKRITFIAATSTLAQGMNFPVATILVHSVHKPYGGGNFSSAEFWNIAGRAGRVGLADKGMVVFITQDDQAHYERYRTHLSENLRSALLAALPQLQVNSDLKLQYKDVKELRPFIQYLAHAAATLTAASAIRNLEELLQSSLAYKQAASAAEARELRRIATAYLSTIARQQTGYLKVVDQTGLASFSFDELYAKLRNDALLAAGPTRVLSERQTGMEHLVEALKWLPELDLAIGIGSGPMSVEAVAEVAQGWMDGKQVFELAEKFPGDAKAKVRAAARYVNSTVSNALSWGAHAYLRGWQMSSPRAADQAAPESLMFPTYLQYGVHTPEAAVASVLGVPRAYAEAVAEVFRSQHGRLSPDNATALRTFVESASNETWERVIETSQATGVNAADLRAVFRQMQGIR